MKNCLLRNRWFFGLLLLFLATLIGCKWRKKIADAIDVDVDIDYVYEDEDGKSRKMDIMHLDNIEEFLLAVQDSSKVSEELESKAF